jgi:predicted MFS family arabinose efflux permease
MARAATPRSMRLVTFTLAFACGASVANLYYAQPLLAPIAHAFGIGRGTAAIIVTVTQIGYAIGLLLLLPTADLLENRKLTSRTLILTAGALVLAAVAPSFWVFLLASAFVGVTTVVAQILVPLAAHLADPEDRGKVVGQVTSGLLLGIMLARSVASFVAAAWGWRAIYGISAGLMLLTSLALLMVLPRRLPVHRAGYGSLLASTFALARTEPVLVRRAVVHACLFGAFTAYWTAVAYELVDRHHATQAGIAVFALIGAAGAGAAPIAGRLADHGRSTAGRLAAPVLAVAAMALAGLGAASLVLLALSGVLLDVAVQSHQVLSLRDIYALRADARARINSVYMTSVFAGGALSSAVTGAVDSAWGWSGVVAFAGILSAVGIVVWRRDPWRSAVSAEGAPA